MFGLLSFLPHMLPHLPCRNHLCCWRRELAVLQGPEGGPQELYANPGWQLARIRRPPSQGGKEMKCVNNQWAGRSPWDLLVLDDTVISAWWDPELWAPLTYSWIPDLEKLWCNTFALFSAAKFVVTCHIAIETNSPALFLASVIKIASWLFSLPLILLPCCLFF